MAATYELIESVVLGSAATEVSFTSIPSTYDDLVVLLSIRCIGTTDNFGDYEILGYQFNSSTSGYSSRVLQTSGSGTAGSQTRTNTTLGGTTFGRINVGVQNAISTANTFTSQEWYVPNYAGSTAKSISFTSMMENNKAEAYTEVAAGLWNNTAAINAVKFRAGADFATGSSFQIYGITKA